MAIIDINGLYDTLNHEHPALSGRGGSYTKRVSAGGHSAPSYSYMNSKAVRVCRDNATFMLLT